MGGNADRYARTLARLDEPEPVRLAIAGETVACVVESIYLGDECIRVDAIERGGGRTFRVQTQWMNGWLDPVVDVSGPDDRGFVPTGPLGGVTPAAGSVAADGRAATAE